MLQRPGKTNPPKTLEEKVAEVIRLEALRMGCKVLHPKDLVGPPTWTGDHYPPSDWSTNRYRKD